MIAAMLIRPARAEDAAAVHQVLLAAGRAAWSDIFDTTEWRPSVELHDAFWVAEDDGRIVGFAAVKPEAGELDLLHVHPDAWGTGVAGLLHDTALAHLKAAGHTHAFLYTEERNHRALAFYRRLGWEPDGRIHEREHEGSRLREPWFRRAL